MTIHEATTQAPRTSDTDRVLTVYVHPDASMTVPKSEWLWALRYQDEPERAAASDRMLAASVGESYRYLITSCDKDEAWHRIQQMRRAIVAYDNEH
jgi:hypothetical protein